MKTVYVAGSSKEIPRAEAAMAFLRMVGWTIAFDWTAPVKTFGTQGLTLDEETRAVYAERNLRLACASDRLLVLWPTEFSEGAYIELGGALSHALDRSDLLSALRTSNEETTPSADMSHIVIAGKRDHIFHALCRKYGGHTFAEDSEALTFLQAELTRCRDPHGE